MACFSKIYILFLHLKYMPDKWGMQTRKEHTFYHTEAGDRALTPAWKRKEKEEIKV